MPKPRQPRRESSPPPEEWGGDHFTVERDGILTLWSFTRTPDGERVFFRASLRGATRRVPQITFDSLALKASARRWVALAFRTFHAMPPEHRRAIAAWHHGDYADD